MFVSSSTISSQGIVSRARTGSTRRRRRRRQVQLSSSIPALRCLTGIATIAPPGNIPALKPRMNYVSGSHECCVDIPRPARAVAKASDHVPASARAGDGLLADDISVFWRLGRTKPSREMVLRLAAALAVPLRNSNELLLLAGSRARVAETAFGALERTLVRDALDQCWPNRNHSRPWSWIGVGMCCKPIGAPSRLLSSGWADRFPARAQSRRRFGRPRRPEAPPLNWGVVVRYFLRTVEVDATADGTAENGGAA